MGLRGAEGSFDGEGDVDGSVRELAFDALKEIHVECLADVVSGEVFNGGLDQQMMLTAVP